MLIVLFCFSSLISKQNPPVDKEIQTLFECDGLQFITFNKCDKNCETFYQLLSTFGYRGVYTNGINRTWLELNVILLIQTALTKILKSWEKQS